MVLLDLMFASDENRGKWIYSKSDWEQSRKDLNMNETVNYFEKRSKDFPGEYLYKPCVERKDAEYRLEIMEELISREKLFTGISDFCLILRRYRTQLRDFKEDKHEIQKQYRFLLLFGEFAAAASSLLILLSDAKSAGLKKIYERCEKITTEKSVTAAYENASSLIREIAMILKNTVLEINTGEKIITIKERETQCETELLREEIFETYALKIKSDFPVTDPLPLSYLEEKVLKIHISKNPETFDELENFYNNYSEALENDLKIFTDLLPQLVFYITYAEFVKEAKKNGVPVCRPNFKNEGFSAFGALGISMIIKFLAESRPLDEIVKNDVRLPKGKIFILSGPNQGGKTVYLKMLGMTAYLAKCGCYVFSEECSLPFYDNIITHFMQKEVLGKSRLFEEIERIENLSTQFNSDSLVLLNESFTSTRRNDSLEIVVHYIEKFDKIGCSAGFVSHFYEIPEVYKNGENDIISMQSGIEKSGERTYKISENKGDGLAYARDIAKSCKMTYEQIIREIETAGGKN